MADTFSPDPAPEVTSSQTSKFRVNVARFGDGYEQRVSGGINPQELTAKLVWRVLSNTEANTLETFFADHPGWVTFDYTLPWEATARKWVLDPGYSRTATGAQRASLTATIREVNDL
jgi:phage-related protein